MIDVVVAVVALVLLARTLWVLGCLLASRRVAAGMGAAAPRVEHPESAPRLVVLLPMLREQEVAPDTLRRFAALPYAGQAAVCVVTTEREEEQRAARRAEVAALAGRASLTAEDLRGHFPRSSVAGVLAEVADAPPAERAARLLRYYDSEPTTSAVVADTIETLDSPHALVHLHQPAVPGRKGSQLNHAVTRLDDIARAAGWSDVDPANTYLLVYDADGVPDRRCLDAIAALTEQARAAGVEPPGLIQQHRLPIRFGSPFPRGLAGAVLAVDWMYQTRRCLAIEQARLLLRDRIARRRLPAPVRALVTPPTYAIGCGMAIRLSVLHRIGGFPEPLLADIGCGYRVSLLGADLAPLRLYVVDEPYTDTRAMVNLLSLAYVAHRRPAAHRPADGSALPAYAQRAQTAKVHLDRMLWVFAGPVCLAALVLAGIAGSPWFFVLLATIVLWGPVTAALILARRRADWQRIEWPSAAPEYRAISVRHAAAAVLLSPLAPFVELAGPVRVVMAELAGRAVRHGKTER